MSDNNDKQEEHDEMIPFFSIDSRDFDKDLIIKPDFNILVGCTFGSKSTTSP
ncbi:MAG: hypothetical protein WA421_13525 [Nitrososphaeraceae archaeon]